MSKLNNSTSLCMTVMELADELQVSRPTAYALTHREGFPVLKVGRRTLILREALTRWLEEHSGNVII